LDAASFATVHMFWVAQLPLSDAVYATARNHRRRADGHQSQAGYTSARIPLPGRRTRRRRLTEYDAERFRGANVRNAEPNSTANEKARSEAEPIIEPSPRSVETKEPFGFFGGGYLAHARPMLRRRHLHSSIVQLQLQCGLFGCWLLKACALVNLERARTVFLCRLRTHAQRQRRYSE
jgi:hypothetical protein